MTRLLPLFALLLLGAAAPGPAGGAESHDVRLRIFDRGKPAAQIEVRVTYPKDGSTIGTTIVLITDRRGFVTFDLPARSFWVSVPALNSEVIGRRFNVPERAGGVARWDLRPREWKRSREEEP